MEFKSEGEAHIAISRWDAKDEIPPYIGGAAAVLAVEDAVAATKVLQARGVRCEDVVTISGVVRSVHFMTRKETASSSPQIPPSKIS